MFDVLISGGKVIDGSGTPAVAADIGITAGRITAVGMLTGADARHTIDATDRLVAPGFIDAHVHGDGLVMDVGVQLAALRQGVTTMVLGQDGLSFAPSDSTTVAWVSGYFAGVNGHHPVVEQRFRETGIGIAELLETYRHCTALNTAYLIPHGTVRHRVMRTACRIPSPDDAAAMCALISAGLDEGAVGLSTGLGYLPGRHADRAELIELCRPLVGRGLPYVTHMRHYGPQADIGLAEAIAIGRDADVPVHISHYHGPVETLISRLEQTKTHGVDVTFDSYPYRRASSILAGILPAWLPVADTDALSDALADSEIRERLTSEFDQGTSKKVVLSHVPDCRLQWCEGLTLADAAARAGLTSGQLCAEVLQATALAAGMIFDHPFVDTDEALRQLRTHACHIGGSDGIFVGGHPHPRGYGAFARYLGRHVRELGHWTWEEAVLHLSTRPATRFRLPTRGMIRRRFAADLIVIDPRTVADRADYLRPRELAVGIDDVVVAGIPVLANGALTGACPGTPLAPS